MSAATPRPADDAAHHGFTLLELVISLIVGGIVVALAAPTFQELQRAFALDAAADRIYDDLLTARNHAITHGVRVTLCPRDGDRCGDVNDWDNGWLMFEDHPPENRKRDPGEPLVLRYRNDPGRIRLTFRKDLPYVFYKHTGLGWPNGTFRICGATGTGEGKRVTIARNGRPRFARPGDDAVNCTENP